VCRKHVSMLWHRKLIYSESAEMEEVASQVGPARLHVMRH